MKWSFSYPGFSAAALFGGRLIIMQTLPNFPKFDSILRCFVRSHFLKDEGSLSPTYMPICSFLEAGIPTLLRRNLRWGIRVKANGSSYGSNLILIWSPMQMSVHPSFTVWRRWFPDFTAISLPIAKPPPSLFGLGTCTTIMLCEYQPPSC